VISTSIDMKLSTGTCGNMIIIGSLVKKALTDVKDLHKISIIVNVPMGRHTTKLEANLGGLQHA